MTNSKGKISGTLAAALAPLQSRLPKAIVEREILRVVATIPASAECDAMAVARDEVLKWARKRAGQDFPREAWEGQAFEALTAGRTTMAACVNWETSELWALRGDDPDKVIPGRIWSTEVSLGRTSVDDPIHLGVRLLVNSSESELVIDPAVPGLVLQISDACGIKDGPLNAWSHPHFAETDEHVSSLIDWIESNHRHLPLIVATGDERSSSPNSPTIDVDLLAKALCGLAHVAFVPANLTYKLSDALGKKLTVFHGGVRIYNPRFDLLSDPFAHRLYLGSIVDNNNQEISSEIRTSIARESLRRTRLGQDVLSFAAVRSASLREKQKVEVDSGSDTTELLSAANARIDALESQISSIENEKEQAWNLSEEEASRAETAEKQLISAWARIEHLDSALKALGDNAGTDDENPDDWAEFSDWCDERFSGRISLTSSARRALRKPAFEDVDLAAKCVRWLADEARNRFIEGGGTLANIPVFDGITNAPCGADEYTVYFQGRRLLINWHLKNGGNTRQPERCLRVYYVFDQISRQIVISDMPAHRQTGAS